MVGTARDRFGILGPLVVEVGGESREPSAPRQRALLTLFLLSPGEPISADRILDRLWGENLPSGGVKTVGFHISKLRDALDPDRERGSEGRLLRTTPAGYVLDAHPETIDAEHFDRLLDESRAVLPNDPGKAAALARDALGLWRGPVLAEFAADEFAQEAIRRLEERRLVAVETRIEADLALGRHLDVVGELERLADEYPLREGLRASLMVALYRSGRQADALRAFEYARRTLADELGIDPSRELRDLEQRILEQDPALDLPVWAAPSAAAPRTDDIPNPYKGLRPFSEADADDFHGRDTLVAEVIDRLHVSGPGSFLALVGPSGCGKSSIVHAGLVPAIRRGAAAGSDKWLIASMYPGARPIEELEIALLRTRPDAPAAAGDLLRRDEAGLRQALRLLAPEDVGVLLIIDQFEELWSLASKEGRVRFLGLIAAALDDPHSALRVVVTLRSDFLGDALEHPGLAGLLGEATMLVPPMRPDEIEAAVTEPARRVAIAVDPALVGVVITDVIDNPGALPLLQYALTETFARRSDDHLDLGSYEAVGGLRGALSRRADEIYESLGADEQHAARQVLLRLITPGDGTADTRRRVPVTEFRGLELPGADIDTVVSAFSEARLVTFDRDAATGSSTIEVAHEALITEWGRFREWVDHARGDLITHRRLALDSAQWEESARDPDYLPTGSRLDLYEGWAAETLLFLTDSEHDYLLAARDHRVAAEAEEEERRRNELSLKRRSVRRLRWLVAVVSVAAIVATALTILAATRTRQAEVSEREARARELAAAAIAGIDLDPELSVILALESIAVTNADGVVLREAEQALHDAVAAHRLIATLPAGDSAAFVEGDYVAVAGEPTWMYSLRGADPIRVDVSSGASTTVGQRVVTMAVSPDGRRIATHTTGERLVQIWDVATGDLSFDVTLPRPLGFGRPVSSRTLAFSHDGRLFAYEVMSGGEDAFALLDATTGDLLTSYPAAPAGFATTAAGSADADISPDGSLFGITFFEDDSARFLDIATGEWSTTVVKHEGPTLGIRFLGPKRVATTGRDGFLRIWHADTGLQETVPSGVGTPFGFDVSPDGTRAAMGGDQGVVTIWDLKASPPKLQLRLAGHSGLVHGVAFDSDGDRVVSSGTDGTKVWDVSIDGAGEVAPIPGPGPFAVAADGSAVAAVLPESQDVAVLDPVTGDARLTIEGVASWPQVVLSVALGPNNLMATTTFAWGDADGTLQLWDTDDGSPIAELLSHLGFRGDVSFSRDGDLVATSICDTLAFWPRPPGTSPVAGTDVRVWNVATGEIVFSAPLAAECGQAAAFDPGGRYLAVQSTGTAGDNVWVWDLETREPVFKARHLPQWLGRVAFSPDGGRLLTVGSDGAGRIWDIDTGEQVLTLQGHTGPVESGGFDPTGERIVTGGVDGTARVWDAATGQQQLLLRCPSGWVEHVIFDPAGDRIHARCQDLSGEAAWAGTSSSLHTWTLDVDELVAIAEERVTRSLTARECITYHFDPCPAAP